MGSPEDERSMAAPGKSVAMQQMIEALAGGGHSALVLDPKGDSVRIDRIRGEQVELLYCGPKTEAPYPDVIGKVGTDPDHEPGASGER